MTLRLIKKRPMAVRNLLKTRTWKAKERKQAMMQKAAKKRKKTAAARKRRKMRTHLDLARRSPTNCRESAN